MKAFGITQAGTYDVQLMTKTRISNKFSFNAPFTGGTIPTVPTSFLPPKDGVACTTVVRFCPNGEVMPRDSSCGWHPEQCGPRDSTTGCMQCTKDAVTGQVSCGTGAPSAY
jgi:hypothetical protein